MDRFDIGLKIKQLRQSHQLGQKALADKLSVTVSTISNWETGRRMPSIEDLNAVAQVFGLSLSYFDVKRSPGEKTHTDLGETKLTQNVEYRTYSLYWDHYEFAAIIFSGILFIVGFSVPKSLSIYFYIVGTFLIAVLTISITNRLVRVRKQNPKKLTLPIDFDVMYVHRYPEERVTKIKRSLSLLAVSSIFTTGFMYLWIASVFGQLSNQYIDLLTSMYAFGAIVVTYFRYKMVDSRESLVKEVDYYSITGNFRASSFFLSLMSSIIALVLVSYSLYFFDNTFDISIIFYFIVGIMFINLLINYILFTGYHHFISKYDLYSYDTNRNEKKIN
jgi:transcriptional regulator with XRE-family HTH domain